MLRWPLLLAMLIRTASTSSPWWCAGEALDSVPEGMTTDEVKAMQLEQEAAALRARNEARARGKGPRVIEKLVESAIRKARDEAHDRFHSRQLQDALMQGEEAAELVPVQALMPAGIVAKMMKEKDRE